MAILIHLDSQNYLNRHQMIFFPLRIVMSDGEEEAYEDLTLIGKFDWKTISRNSSQKWLKDYKVKSVPQNLNFQWDSPPMFFFRLLFQKNSSLDQY